MAVQYDMFTSAFLSKISDYDFLNLMEDERTAITDGYLKRSINGFKYVCQYDFAGSANDANRSFDVQVPDAELDEIVDIVSEGMVVQWLKTYLNKQELLQNVLNTRDYSTYSPAELLMRVGNAYRAAQKDYLQMVNEYSYNRGNLTELHV